MAETKNEKKTTTKKTINKKTNQTTNKTTKKTISTKNTNKTNSTKKVSTNSPKKNVSLKKTSSKTPTKKTTPKKVTTTNKNQVPKKTTKKVVNQQNKPTPKQPQVKEITKEEQLEKTLIFDGRENQNLIEVVEKLEEQNVVLEDKVIKRSKFKKIAIIVLTILIIGIIAATTMYVVNAEVERKESNQTINSNIYKKVAKKYKTISEINKQAKKDKETAVNAIEEIEYSNIKTISLTEFETKILEKEDMTILIASSTCYPCITFEPTINEVYGEKNSVIYRINISLLSENEINRFRTYYAFKVTPTIFTIKDGIATSESTGVLSKDELISWIDENA
ncbi:MAG: thioredoxin family protein [Candidatus Coprovivens sp.]